MKKILYITLLLSYNLFSQSLFKVDFDYSRFNYDEKNGFLEIYYSFFIPSMAISTVDSSQTVRGILQVNISDINGNSFVNQPYQFNNEIKNDSGQEGQKKLTGSLGFILPFGKYFCYLKAADGIDTTRVDTISFEVNLQSPPSEYFSMSDLQLASSIKESNNTGSVFYKNTYEVIPNASGIFGEQLPIVFFYSELYNTNVDVRAEHLLVEHLLLNAGNQLIQKKTKRLPRKTSSIVEVGAINITKLPTGTYNIVLSVRDSIKNVAVYATKKLFIYNPSVVDTSSFVITDQGASMSEFAVMSDEELDDAFGYSRYIATDKEIDQWKSLTNSEGKKTFLYNFWKGRDSDPSTPGNEFKKEYDRRVITANQEFATIQKKGWKTDRGKVFISVGKPSEIERYPNQTDTKPYEIWHYNEIEGGVIFVFTDLTGFSDYQLIHSTMRGELRDDNWMRRIMIQ
ncbi:MAG: GWxTD domain-containing protein [Ignavibacteriales bacterium]|nr:MAG: GWxTD domain-containing protein [Ignavibacteriales bacterium]